MDQPTQICYLLNVGLNAWLKCRNYANPIKAQFSRFDNSFDSRNDLLIWIESGFPQAAYGYLRFMLNKHEIRTRVRDYL